MALTIPQGIYSLGAVKVDSQPLAALQGKLMAQEQERQKELEKYFQSFEDKVSPTGVLDIDQPVIAQKTNDWKNWTQQNKKALYRGDVKTVQEFKSRYNDIQNTIQQSKDDRNFMGKVAASKIYAKDNQILNSFTHPIGDPLRLKPDGTRWSELDLAEKRIPQFDLNKRDDFIKSAIGTLPYDKMSYEPVKGVEGIKGKNIWVFSPQTEDKIARNAAHNLLLDESADKYYEDLKANPKNPEFVRLAGIWEARHGKGNFPQTKEELAMADAYDMIGGKSKIDFVEKEKPKAPSGDGTKITTVSLEELDAIKDIIPLKKRVTLLDGSTVEAIPANEIEPDLKSRFKTSGVIDKKGKEFFIVEGRNLRGKNNQIIPWEMVARSYLTPTLRLKGKIKESQSKTPAPTKGKKTGASGL